MQVIGAKQRAECERYCDSSKEGLWSEHKERNKGMEDLLAGTDYGQRRWSVVRMTEERVLKVREING